MDIVSYALSKKIAEGAVSGVASMSVSGQTLNIECTDGTHLEMDFPTPADGVSITDVDVRADKHLIVTLSNGNEVDAGEVPTVKGDTGEKGDDGADGKSAYEIAVEQGYSGTEAEWIASLHGDDGEDGFSPEITVKESTSERYVLTITTKDGSFDTVNLKGGGSGSASAMSDLEDVQLTSLTTGQILKWNGSKWVNEDGVEIDSLGDINDVALGTLTDGQVLSWNATLGKWENKDAVNPTQFASMPTASEYPQAVIQYIGGDTSDYKRGYFYRSTPSVVSGEVVYTWTQIAVQPSNDDYANLSNLPQINNVELINSKSLDDLGINGKFQYDVLPTATSANAGAILQFTGNTTADYKKGYWYISSYDADTAGYKWAELNVSGNTALANRIAQIETNIGDMSALEVTGVSTLVAALNALNGKGLSTITYTEPNLILTYSDGSTKTFDVKANILTETQIGELANVTDTAIQNTNVLQYDSAILGYKPYDIVLALTNLLQSAKDYTDEEIAGAVQDDALFVDDKPVCSYDSGEDKYVVVYYQNGQVHTTTNTTTRFYYKDTNDDPWCTSWFITGNASVDPVEFTYLLSSVNLDTFVNKNTDITSTYTTDMADKSKVPNVSALDALMALVNTALALKVNTSSIVDALTSQDATKVLSANQGYVIKSLIDAKNDKMQYATMPTASSALSGIVYMYVGASSSAYTKGHMYTCLYDNETDTWYWSEIKYSADTDAALDDTSENPVQNKVIKAALDDKQDKDLETPIVVEGVSKTTVEDTLSALNTYADKKIEQYATLPTASASIENKVVQYIGSTTSTLTNGYFYKCVSDGESTPTYSWSQVNVQDSVSVDGTTIVKDADTDEISAVTATNSTKGIVQHGDGTEIGSNGEINVVDRLEKKSALPTADIDELGKQYLYIGATTSSLTKGGIYECVSDGESTPTYSWVLISTSPLEAGKGITIEDDVISADTNIFHGTVAEYEALSQAEQMKYSHIGSEEIDDTEIINRDFTPNNVITGGTILFAKYSKIGHLVRIDVAFNYSPISIDDTTTITLFELPSSIPYPEFEIRPVVNGVAQKDKPLACYVTTDGMVRCNMMDGYSGEVRPFIHASWFTSN